MKRYCFLVLVVFYFAFAIITLAGFSKRGFFSESVFIKALENGSSLVAAEILSIRNDGGMYYYRTRIIRPIVLGDLTEEYMHYPLDLFAGASYGDALKPASKYALFVAKECPYYYSWAFRDDIISVDVSDEKAIQNLVEAANAVYAKTQIRQFRQAPVLDDVKLPPLRQEILTLCDQFKTNPKRRAEIGSKIYESDLGSRRDDSQPLSSKIRYLPPKVSLSRSQILSLLGEPTHKNGWTYSWLCGQSVERGWVGRDVYVLSVTFDEDEETLRLLFQQQKKDKWTKLRVCVNELYGLPGQPESVLLGFQKALQRRNWQNTLSFCSRNIHKKAQEYESLEKFFRDFLPIEDLEKMRQFPTTGYSSRSDKIMKINLDLSLSIFDPETYESVEWKWSLVRGKEKWLVDFKTILLEVMVQKELLRKELRDEDYETRSVKFEKGIKYLLIPLVEYFVIGKPMPFRIEMKNIGDVPILYMMIGPLMINDPMDVIGPDGEEVKYVDIGSQTFVGEDVILPEETIILVENYDAISQYYIIVPGRYSFQFKSSSTIEVDVKPGEMSAPDEIYTKLLNILPQGWTITRRLTSSPAPYLFVDESDTYLFVHMIGKRRGLQIDVDVRLAILDDESPLLNSNIFDGYQVWGKCKWGYVYCRNRDAYTLWPDYREQIVKALDIKEVKDD